MGALPEFVAPMLARLGREPFDSEDHLFEIKWDGTRSLAFVEDDDYRLLNRNQNDQRPRYPELEFFRELPSGTLLDGEIVVLRDGLPSFRNMLKREQARDPKKVVALARSLPATYVVFDVLFVGGESVMERPLRDRRERLVELVAGAHETLGDRGGAFALSEGITGAGTAFFDVANARELEGIVAKDLDSPYRSGQRTDEWIKIKTFQQILCAIVGYIPEGERDIKSLVVATLKDGELTCVGKVGSGLTTAMRHALVQRLSTARLSVPVVSCPYDGRWVEPELYCTVSFLEYTDDGMLRAPVFVGLVDGS